MDLEYKKQILRKLKESAGTHSPSPKEIVSSLGYNPIKHDFCFLSNPYATDIVVDKFHSLLSNKNEIFTLLESYPATSNYVARNICEYENLIANYMVIGNGAIQAIDWVCNGWNLKKLLIPTPTFSSYYELINQKYLFIDNFWLNSKLNHLELLNIANQNNCDSILLIYPNNPSGEVFSIDKLNEFIDKIEDKKLIIDESFSHFLNNYNEFKLFRNELRNKNVVFIKSMSKDYGIAGLRLGYLYSQDISLINYAKSKTTWNLNNFSVLFSEFLKDNLFKDKYEEARIEYIINRDIFYNELKKINTIKVFPTQANFFLIQFDSIKYPDLVYDLLLKYGVYVRTMEDKVGLDSSFIRVASRKKEDNILFINSLIDYMK